MIVCDMCGSSKDVDVVEQISAKGLDSVYVLCEKIDVCKECIARLRDSLAHCIHAGRSRTDT